LSARERIWVAKAIQEELLTMKGNQERKMRSKRKRENERHFVGSKINKEYMRGAEW